MEIEIIIGIVVALLGLIAIPWLAISKISGKIGNKSEQVAITGDQLADLLQGIGMNRASTIVKEAADVPDELGDVGRVLAEVTADGNFTKEDALKVFAEGKDVVVEGKDFVMKVFKKK